MKRLLWIVCFLGLQTVQANDRPIYLDAKQPIEKRVEDLLQRMTLDEKIYQLRCWYMAEGSEIYRSSKEHSMDEIRNNIKLGYGSVSTPGRNLYAEQTAELINRMQKIAIEETRLGIPLLVDEEALHGIDVYGATCFPQPIGMASTWDLDLMRRIGHAIGKETQTSGITQVMSPVLDLGREARHGRVTETFGEDPLLVSLMGGTFILEVQKCGVACTPKHFAANFVTEAGREAANIELSERALREAHLVPYEYAVTQCGAMGVMTAYNAINGIPCTMNRWLLDQLLRQEWKFNGVVVSDWSSIAHLYNFHHCVDDLLQAAAESLKAGLDIDLPHGECYALLRQAVEQGVLSEADIDVNVRRVLSLKFRLGLFENPYRGTPKEAKRLRLSTEHRELALEAAHKSIVLLKNDSLLPLQKKIRHIAVIGPNADAVRLGGYTAYGVKAATPLEGLKRCLAKDSVKIRYEKGTDLFSGDDQSLQRAIETARQADVAILFVGGDGNNDGQSSGGEAVDRADLRLMGRQEELIERVAETGTPVVVVIVDGRPVVVRHWIDRVDAVLMMWYGGQAGGEAIADILTGKCNPSGKLPITFPQTTGQCPLYYSYHPMGRSSRTADLPGDYNNHRYNPAYPFGYGLSYTTFRYGELTVSDSRTTTPTITVPITNTGSMAGDEVVQLYLSSKGCRIVRRVKELKAFQRIHLEPGETKHVSFSLSPQDFMFLNESFEKELDTGEYEVLVGSDSENGVRTTLRVEQ